jgi:cyclohexa-1,5-dienecarbonyl-CoA hydratase
VRPTGKLGVERQWGGAVLRLTIDVPRGNVLDGEIVRAIGDALAAEGHDPRLRCIVFAGAGAHFSFGASVAEHTRDRAPAMLREFHALFRQLAGLHVPTAAIVRGQCLGGGLELASYCTWIFAAPDARFGQPEIALGVFPPMASLILPWRIGGGAALDLCVSGRSIGADEALRRGLVNVVTETPEEALATFLAEHVLPRSASSLRFAERAARLGLARLLEDTLPALERLYLDELMLTEDANEGIAAFLERRRPRFGGAGEARQP